MPLDVALSFEERVQSGGLPYKVNYVDGLVYEHVDLQLNNSILKDLNVRKALVYSIDRDTMSKAFFKGKQKKAIHFISPSDPWFTDDPKKIVLYRYSLFKGFG